MLGTKYHVYKHLDTETTLIQTTSYSLPSVLRDHVTVITPSTYFNLAKPRYRHSFAQKAEGITFQLTPGKTLSAWLARIRRVKIKSPLLVWMHCTTYPIRPFRPRRIHWAFQDF